MIGNRGLYARTFDALVSRDWWVPITSEECWKCGTPNPDLAHSIYEYVAAIIGTELERRVWATVAEHEAIHGCRLPGYWHSCPESWEIIQLLPEGMIPVAIG